MEQGGGKQEVSGGNTRAHPHEYNPSHNHPNNHTRKDAAASHTRPDATISTTHALSLQYSDLQPIGWVEGMTRWTQE